MFVGDTYAKAQAMYHSAFNMCINSVSVKRMYIRTLPVLGLQSY